jgi:APA family basic amino acid/polyamine antiporter
MLGGIFPTVGPGAMAAGPASVLAFVISGGVCVAVALCYAEFASMVPVAGSAYTYAYATLGELVAWIIGWDLILEYGVSVAPTASSWSSYAQGLLVQFGHPLPIWAQGAKLTMHGAWWQLNTLDFAHSQIDVLAALIVVAITLLVAIGIRESANVNATFVVIQMIAMLVFLAVLIPHVHSSNLHPFAPFGYHGIINASALVFFAYIGFDTVTVASEEARNAPRDVPIGILLSLVIGALLFCSIAFVTSGTLSYKHFTGDGGAAMSDAMSAVTHNWLLIDVVAIGGLAGNFTVMLTSLLGQIRIFYVMARDRMLPPGVARVHPRFRTPARMTMITGLVVALLAAVYPLDILLRLVNIGTLSAFAIVCAGVLVLRIVNPGAPRPFRAPLAPIFTVLGALGCLYLIVAGLGPATWLRFGLWFLVGIGVYALYGYRNSRLARLG